jgi:NAD(P)-dependent dehydrogenase (short-subunit alcohol dehydrogenase family)
VSTDGAQAAARWDVADIGSLAGRTAVITGANTGIGFETATVLAAAGARVILACRNESRGLAALESIRARTPGALLDLEMVDIADLDSVRAAAKAIAERVDQIDLLINNAGVAFPPPGRSPQGVELQLATNFLGHFALTGLLLDRLLAAPAARVVGLTSLAHHGGRLRPAALDGPRQPGPLRAYGRSKLAVLVFGVELNRRFVVAQLPARALTAHPGGAKTELLRHGVGPRAALSPSAAKRLLQFQSAEMGALPTLRAALDPSIPGGVCVAPGGLLELRGHPRVGRTGRRPRNPAVGRELWAAAEKLTDVRYVLR